MHKYAQGKTRDSLAKIAGVSHDAESKIGELLNRIPPQEHGESGKFEKKIPEGITHKQSHFFKTLASNPEIVVPFKLHIVE